MKKKFVISLVVLGFAMVTGASGYVWKVNANSKQVDFIATKVNELFINDSKEFLSSSVKEEVFSEINSKVDKVKGKTINKVAKIKLSRISKDLKYAKTMYTLQIEVRGLLDSKGAIADNVDIIKIEQQANKFKKIKPKFVQTIITPVLENVKLQKYDIVAAKDQVNALFQDANTVKGDVTRDSYTTAKGAAEKVKNESVKSTLETMLEKVNAALIEKENAIALAQAQQQTQNVSSSTISQTKTTNGKPKINSTTSNTSSPLIINTPTVVNGIAVGTTKNVDGDTYLYGPMVNGHLSSTDHQKIWLVTII